MAYLCWGLHRCWASGPPLIFTIKHTPALCLVLILENNFVMIERETNKDKSGLLWLKLIYLLSTSKKYIVLFSAYPRKDVFSQLILYYVSSPPLPPRSVFISFPTSRHKMSCTSCLNTSAVQTAWLMRMDVPQQSSGQDRGASGGSSSCYLATLISNYINSCDNVWQSGIQYVI